MKKNAILWGSIFFGLTVLCHAQQQETNQSENRKAWLSGGVSDGVPPAPTPQPDPPEFKINWSQEIRQGGRKVMMQEVEAPLLIDDPISPSVEREPLSAEQLAELRSQFEQLSQGYFFVSATTYGRATLVKWSGLQNEQKKELSCWSNINFAHLGGFASFHTKDQKFTFFMAHGSQSLKQLRKLRRQNPNILVPKIPVELPLLRDSGPRYIMIDGEEEAGDQAMDFIEAIHDLYAANKRELRQAYRSRKKQQRLRAEELRLNPPKPQDIEISFWNNNVNK